MADQPGTFFAEGEGDLHQILGPFAREAFEGLHHLRRVPGPAAQGLAHVRHQGRSGRAQGAGRFAQFRERYVPRTIDVPRLVLVGGTDVDHVGAALDQLGGALGIDLAGLAHGGKS